MYALLAALLILTPAPKVAPPPPNPMYGAKAIDWGACKQTTFFYGDGTCYSPEFGNGTWVEHEGAIWFTEQNGTQQYMMEVDLLTGEGTGHHVHEGLYGPLVEVKIRRGERLPMPRIVE